MTKTRSLIESVRFVREVNGYNTALGIYGTPEEIQAVFMVLSNSGVTSGELLDCGGETFAYCWTDAEKFPWYLARWEAQVLSDKGLPKRSKLEACTWFYNLWKFWNDFFEAIELENFVPEHATVDLLSADFATGEYERPSRLAVGCED